MSDDSSKRVTLFFHEIPLEQLKPGDHIYCYGCCWRSTNHAIYAGQDEVIFFKGDASKTGASSSEYIIRGKLAWFLGLSTVRLVAYNEPFLRAFGKKRTQSHYVDCYPADKVIQRAKYYLNTPKRWEDYHRLFYDSESFAFFCKAIDDSSERVGWLSHAISEGMLKPGDHIYSYRLKGLTTHHGIYVGKRNCEVIHFARAEAEATPEPKPSSAHVQKCSLSEFLDSYSVRLVPYNQPFLKTVFESRMTCHTMKSCPADEVVETAEHYLMNPEKWQGHSTSESFANYCKTKAHNSHLIKSLFTF